MRDFGPLKNHFDLNLCGPANATVLLQSFANPAFRLETWEYRQLETAFDDAAPASQDVRPWKVMVQISELMQQARTAIASGSDLTALAVEADWLQTLMQSIVDSVHDRLRAWEESMSKQVLDVKKHASFQRQYGVSLATMAMLLCVRRTLSPEDLTVEDTASHVCQEVLDISHDAQAYRPLGAVWTVHALICVWCATHDMTLRAKVIDAMMDYQRDATGPKAELRLDSLRLLERRLSLVE